MSPRISSTTATEIASDNANATPNVITSLTMTFMIRLFSLFVGHVDPHPNSGHRIDCQSSKVSEIDTFSAASFSAFGSAKCPKRTIRHNAAENVLVGRLQGGPMG
jgi:hypothetical protein